MSRNVLLSEKFRASVCAYDGLCLCEKVHDMHALVFCSAKMYAVKGLKVVFSQTLAICSAKQ